MAEQAYAYVTLIPVAKGFQQKAAQELSGLGGIGSGLGDKAAAGFSSGFAGSLKKLIGPAALIGAGLAIGNFFSSAVKGASNLQAEFEGVNQVFGSSAKAVQDYAKQASTLAGLTEVEALRASKSMGLFAKSAGLSSDGAAKFSTDLVQLAGDLGSFNDVPTGDALMAIQSGLQGQAEPLRKFGVFLTDDALKAEAMAMKLGDGTSALTAQQKMLASYSLIMKSTTIQQGDFVKYATDFGNAQKTMSANFENMKNTLATNLLPVLGQLMAAMSPLITQMGPLLFNVFQKLIPVFELLTNTVKDIMPIIGPLIDIFGMMLDVVLDIIKIALPPLIDILKMVIPVITVIVKVFTTFIRAILPSLSLLIQKVLMPVLGFLVDFLVRYIIPIWMRVAEILGKFLPIAIQIIVKGFELLAKVLGPVYNTVIKPLFEGLMALAGIKPIKIQASMDFKGFDTGTLGNVSDLGAIDFSKVGDMGGGGLGGGTGASAKKIAAAAKKARAAMVKSFRKDILANIGPEIYKDADALTKFSESAAAFIQKGLEDKTITAKAGAAAKKIVSVYTAMLAPLIAEHKTVMEQLNKAQDDLLAKTEARAAYIASIVDKYGNKLNIAEDTTATTAIQQLKDRITNTKALLGFMSQLRTMGLSGDLYQQILESGNLDLAKSIVEGGDSAIKELNALAAEANATALKLGEDAAMILHDKGIEVAKGVVEGLKAREADLTAQMEKLAKAFADLLDEAITGSIAKAQAALAALLAANKASTTGGPTQTWIDAGIDPVKAQQDYANSQKAFEASGLSVSAYMRAVDAGQTFGFQSAFSAPATAAPTINYYAAENQSLDSAAALSTAISRSQLFA